MKIIGMLFIVASAMFFSFEKSASEERRILLIEELLRFIERIRGEISRYLRPLSEISASFSSELLSDIGFLKDIEEKGVGEAYKNLKRKIRFSEEEGRILERFFSMLGHGYAEEEIKLIDATVSELSEHLKRERENLPKQKKLSVTLSCSAALALIILLI